MGKEKLQGICDIHSHVIPNVDDGSTSLEHSIEMIKSLIEQGVSDLICTPHFRSRMFEPSLEAIQDNYRILEEEVKKRNLNIHLYLGREIFVTSTSGSLDRLKMRIKENVVQSLQNSAYYLLEFSYTKEIEISEIVYSLSSLNIKPIIAHVERYEYLDNNIVTNVAELKSSGALIQVNASAIVGADGGKIKKRVWQLLKNNLVDIVASDLHQNRINFIEKAYHVISKKLGIEKAKELFILNPKQIIK